MKNDNLKVLREKAVAVVCNSKNAETILEGLLNKLPLKAIKEIEKEMDKYDGKKERTR